MFLPANFKSGRAQPHSRTLAREPRRVAIPTVFGVRQCFAALVWVILAFAFFTQAAVFEEDFSSDPVAHGWNIFGKTNLFHWNSTNQNLEVTWDSSKTNSYFFKPLGTIGTASDSFSLSFDLVLLDITNQGAFEITI